MKTPEHTHHVSRNKIRGDINDLLAKLRKYMFTVELLTSAAKEGEERLKRLQDGKKTDTFYDKLKSIQQELGESSFATLGKPASQLSSDDLLNMAATLITSVHHKLDELAETISPAHRLCETMHCPLPIQQLRTVISDLQVRRDALQIEINELLIFIGLDSVKKDDSVELRESIFFIIGRWKEVDDKPSKVEADLIAKLQGLEDEIYQILRQAGLA